MNWVVIGIGAAIAACLLAIIGFFGGLRWWQRLRPVWQICLMLVIPSVMLGLTLLVAWFSPWPIEEVGSLVIGVTLGSGLVLVTTSYLAMQIWWAFQPDEPAAASEPDEHA
ncbi:hypothetical protein ACP8Y2_07910 [Herpetosiphon llansteffanensis]